MIRLLPMLFMGLALSAAANMLSPLFDLHRASQAQADCNAIERELLKSSPDAGLFLSENFAGFLRAHKLPILDPWGTRYRVERSGALVLRVRSAGPDRAFESTDDVVSASD